MAKYIRKIVDLVTRILIVGVMLWMQLLSIATMHSHTLPNGQVVWHFHPLGQGENGSSPTNHTHNSNSFQGFSWNSTHFLSSHKPTVPLSLSTIVQCINIEQTQHLYLVKTRSIRLRAPPIKA